MMWKQKLAHDAVEKLLKTKKPGIIAYGDKQHLYRTNHEILEEIWLAGFEEGLKFNPFGKGIKEEEQ